MTVIEFSEYRWQKVDTSVDFAWLAGGVMKVIIFGTTTTANSTPMMLFNVPKEDIITLK
jgi:hypothetical protein